MVIEIDRKKVAQAKRLTWVVVFYLLLACSHLYRMVKDLMRDNLPPWTTWMSAFCLLAYLLMAATIWQAVRRAWRHYRTEHHLFIDETGIGLINGHARVDIPWDDVATVSITTGKFDPWLPRNIKIQVGKETPYNKRTYCLYNDYETSLDNVYLDIDKMWSAGQAKPKLLTI